MGKGKVVPSGGKVVELAKVPIAKRAPEKE